MNKKQLIDRQGYIIRSYCNSIGCKDCPLERENGDCECTDIDSELLEMEIKEYA